MPLLTTECGRCRRPVGDAFVCATCGADLERALAGVPALADELGVAVSRQARFTGANGSRSAEKPLPLNQAASDATSALTAILVTWVRANVEATGADYPDATLAAMSNYLTPRVGWIRHRDDALKAVEGILAAIGAALRAIDAPANRTTFVVGPCPEIGAQDLPCGGMVRAYIPTSADEPARMECSECRWIYEPHQWLRAGRRILDRLHALRP